MPAPIIAAAVGAGVGLVGQWMANKSREEAERILQAARARFGGVSEPILEKMRAEELGESEEGKVVADPGLKAAQMAALHKLQGVSDAGGMTLEDRAVEHEALGRAAKVTGAGMNRIDQQMQARGAANSGGALAMQMQSVQDGAEGASAAGRHSVGQAQKRALEAMMASGQLAGGLRNQDFGERSKAAEARDAFAKYNNAVRNNAQQHNLGLGQKAFENSMSKTGAMAGMDGALAGMKSKDGDRTAQQFAGYGQAAYEVLSDDDDKKKKGA